jgi:hypothetical protein
MYLMQYIVALLLTLFLVSWLILLGIMLWNKNSNTYRQEVVNMTNYKFFQVYSPAEKRVIGSFTNFLTARAVRKAFALKDAKTIIRTKTCRVGGNCSL